MRGRPQRVLKPEEIAKLREMRIAQQSLEECAWEFGTGTALMQRLLVKHKLNGRVCPHCGKGFVNPKVGRPRRFPLD